MHWGGYERPKQNFDVHFHVVWRCCYSNRGWGVSNQIAIFERVILVLKMIQNTPVATTSEVQNKALSGMCLRSVQRYLRGLEQSGYIKRKCDSGWNRGESRYFLTDKAKQLFGANA